MFNSMCATAFHLRRFLSERDPDVTARTHAGLHKFRAAAERALTAGGMHLPSGAQLWTAYRCAPCWALMKLIFKRCEARLPGMRSPDRPRFTLFVFCKLRPSHSAAALCKDVHPRQQMLCTSVEHLAAV